MNIVISIISKAVLGTAILCLSVSAAAAGNGGTRAGDSEPQFEPGQMLVQFVVGADLAMQDRALARIGAKRQELIVSGQRRGDAKGDLTLVALPPGLAVSDALVSVRFESTIEFAEPNYIYQHQATSNDTFYTDGSLWSMYGDASSPANQYGSQAAEAWAGGNTCSSDVYVGIIDEVFMINHEDLAANAWTNPFDPVDGTDNDGNGYIDDVNGWDFDGGDNTVFDGVGDDHGTHVSGTVAGIGGNGIGVAGVCWNATLPKLSVGNKPFEELVRSLTLLKLEISQAN